MTRPASATTSVEGEVTLPVIEYPQRCPVCDATVTGWAQDTVWDEDHSEAPPFVCEPYLKPCGHPMPKR